MREDFWDVLSRYLEVGPAFLTLVAENSRHSPGTVGARLVVAASGQTFGTIGGGIMERDLIARAREILLKEKRFAEVRTLHHRKYGAGEPSGMICAGHQTNLSYLCRPDVDGEAVARIAAWSCADRSATLTLAAEGLSVEEGPPDLSRSPRRLVRDGERWRYEEELLNRRRLAILGGGHCALALARVMDRLGYDVLAFEATKKPADDELTEHVRQLEVVTDFRDAGKHIAFPELTWVVVMTSDFPSDVRALLGVVDRPFPFIGVMGSPAKLREIRRCLEAGGCTTEQLERLRAPVGLPIGSETPEEIAISVAAQILQERRSVESGSDE